MQFSVLWFAGGLVRHKFASPLGQHTFREKHTGCAAAAVWQGFVLWLSTEPLLHFCTCLLSKAQSGQVWLQTALLLSAARKVAFLRA